jgi:hypothetical protein
VSRAETIARYCEAHGFYLVAIPAGTKGPRGFDWQKPEKAICTHDAALDYWTRNPDHNVGLLHAPSGTAAWDVDNVDHTRLICSEMGIDYDAIMASAPRIVGRKDRGKVLFRIPRGLDLKTHKISWPIEGDPRKTEVVFELRAGGVQDVLPPSIHPDTGNPYTWGGPSIDDGIPEIPTPLLSLWTEWDRFRPQLQDICPWRVTPTYQPPRKPRPQGDRASVIDAFNGAHDIMQLLEQFGYKRTGRNRFLSPNSTSKLAGVVVFDDGRAYSHHASDPFDSAHAFDAFDLWCQYEHMGDVAKAVKDAAIFLNVDKDAVPEYDAEAVQHGAKVAASILPSRQKKPVTGPLDDIPEHLLSIPGRLQDAVNYYTTTAPKSQPQFAVQAALAFGSVVMGRRWVTDQNNYTGLYFINVGKSAAGKEHAKTVIENLLEHAKLERLIGPAGYTSASGVFSALVEQPAHITVIDELGRVLSASQSQGNHNKADAQTILMETFGRMHATLRPQGYSKMGMSKTQSAEFDKVIRHPSLTIMSMTTPSTLYESLSSRYVSDGFLGRFLIVESNIGRQVSKPIRTITPPESLLEWAAEHAEAKAGNLDAGTSYDTPPPAVEVPFGPGCQALIEKCDADMMERMDRFEKYGMEAMFGRTKEIAQRLALIVARSCREEQISTASMQWAIDYATFYADRTVSALRQSMSDGPFEAACKSVMAMIEASGLKGVTEREIARSSRTFAGLEPRRRREVMEALAADRGIIVQKQAGGVGRPRMAWIAPAEAD